jgi:hypothetical protein
MADFWSLINQARVTGGPTGPSASPDALKKVLSELPPEAVQEFAREFSRKLIELNRWDLWAAGYAICGGMGDDSFHYFRSWIIGKGPECFEAAVKDPSGLLPYLDNSEYDNELLEYVALEVLESLGITEDPRDGEEGNPDDEPSGEPFDEDEVTDRFPHLASFSNQTVQKSNSVSEPSKRGFFQSILDRLRPRNE